MNPATLRWYLLGYAVLVILLIAIDSKSGSQGVGVSLNWVGDDYSFSGGAPPWTLFFAAANACLYALLFWSGASASSSPMPHLFRRFLAGLLDWFLSIMTVAPLLGLISVLIEYGQTGVFDWVIERHEPRPLDALQAFGGVLILFVAMTFYMAIPLSKGKPTLGACIAGYRVAPDEGTELTFWFACLRALLGSVALLGWPCWIMAYALKRDKEHGRFWLDLVFRTHAEYLV